MKTNNILLIPYYIFKSVYSIIFIGDLENKDINAQVRHTNWVTEDVKKCGKNKELCYKPADE